MSIFSRRTGDVTFTRVGWLPALGVGSVVGMTAAVCELSPAAEAFIGTATVGGPLAYGVIRLAARELRIRRRLRTLGPVPSPSRARRPAAPVSAGVVVVRGAQ
ncbi:hypothetical protein ACFQV8_01070 [Pseudonocardia benzenivorans]